MNELTNISHQQLDGFEYDDDESGNNLIQGSKIKFTLDFKWVIARSDEVIDPQREFLVMKIVRVVQKWLPGHAKPVENRILRPGEKFPDLEKLNNDAPRSEWRDKFGKRVGPYQGAYVVYLIEVSATSKKVAAFTWVADIDTAGANRAINDLRKNIDLTRRVQGRLSLFPRVKLSDTFMPTQYGGRQRPHFDIVDYEPLGPEPEAPAQIEPPKPKQVERVVELKARAKRKLAEPIISDDDELNDPIPELD